jgi:DNA ligase-1
VDQGLEGIVSKRDSRPPNVWLKKKNYQYATVCISEMRKEKFGWSLMDNGRYVGVMEFVPPEVRKAFFKFSFQLRKGEDKKWI